MSFDAQLQKTATAAAEAVLQRIYGDDLQGCTVSLDSVASAIAETFREHAEEDRQLFELFEKAIEAIQLLSTPPRDGAKLTPPELQSLLGERLDSIGVLATKMNSAITAFKAQRAGEAGEAGEAGGA